jgi:hypothetical protein
MPSGIVKNCSAKYYFGSWVFLKLFAAYNENYFFHGRGTQVFLQITLLNHVHLSVLVMFQLLTSSVNEKLDVFQAIGETSV